MNIRQLECIAAVQRLGSLSAAAKELGLTQQAVSKSIKGLEEELGIELFQRTINGMIPTEQTSILHEAARDILSDIDLFKRTASKLSQSSTNRISVGVVKGIIGGSEAPIAINDYLDFANTMPDVFFELQEMPAKDVGHMAHMGLLDLGVTTDVPSPRCVGETLFSAPLKAVVSSKSPLAEMDEIDWVDLKGMRIVSTFKGTWLQTRIVERCSEAGFLPDFATPLEKFSGNVALALSENVVFLSHDAERVRQADPKRVRILDFREGVRLDMHVQFIWNMNNPPTVEGLRLMDFFKQQLMHYEEA